MNKAKAKAWDMLSPWAINDVGLVVCAYCEVREDEVISGGGEHKKFCQYRRAERSIEEYKKCILSTMFSHIVKVSRKVLSIIITCIFIVLMVYAIFFCLFAGALTASKMLG